MKKSVGPIGTSIIFISIGLFFAYSLLSPDKHQKRDVVQETYIFLKKRLAMEDRTLINMSVTINQEAKKNDIDYRLILAMIKVESDFDNYAVSEQGARGLLQIKPSLAAFIVRDLGIEWHGSKTLHEPEKNIKIGVYFLSRLIEEFGDLERALVAYNVGSTRFKELLKENAKPKMSFSKKVLREYRRNLTLLPDPE